jgi:hypothetical protein
MKVVLIEGNLRGRLRRLFNPAFSILPYLMAVINQADG